MITAEDHTTGMFIMFYTFVLCIPDIHMINALCFAGLTSSIIVEDNNASVIPVAKNVGEYSATGSGIMLV